MGYRLWLRWMEIIVLLLFVIGLQPKGGSSVYCVASTINSIHILVKKSQCLEGVIIWLLT